MTFLPGGEVALLEAVRQKGEAELRVQCQCPAGGCDSGIATYEERSVCREAIC